MDPLVGIRQFPATVAYETYAPFLDRLAAIFAAIDKAYQAAADYYHFHCTGCDDSCCLTRFYHHTLLEYFFILEGYKSLSRQKQMEIEQRAWNVCRNTEKADRMGATVRVMCPLNSDGLCLMYDFRPMICRLHGVPHELHGADGHVMQGKGCDMFYRQCSQITPTTFDRTPFYVSMANLENELRDKIDVPDKIKMTIAQMIVSFSTRKS